MKIKSKKLKTGDKVGLITPGSPITILQYKKTVQNLKALGLEVVSGKYLHEHNGYISGTDQQRVDDLHNMFLDDDIDAVWCVRGGYGCGRILEMLDFSIFRNNPKILIGYSDVTVLLNAIYQETGLVTFHGPIGAAQFTPFVLDNIHNTLMQSNAGYVIEKPFGFEEEDEGFYEEVYTEGIARGELAGGNLALISSVMGTPYQVDLKGKLAFIEDIHEKPYQLDRMLQHLQLGKQFDEVSGLMLGVFADCQPKPTDDSKSLNEMLQDQFGGIEVPAMYGLPFGHIDHNCILPIGVEAELDTFEGKITLLESGVV